MALVRPTDKSLVFLIEGQEVTCDLVESAQKEEQHGPISIYQIPDQEQFREDIKNRDPVKETEHQILERHLDKFQVTLEKPNLIWAFRSKRRKEAFTIMIEGHIEKYLDSKPTVHKIFAAYFADLSEDLRSKKSIATINQDITLKLIANINKQIAVDAQLEKERDVPEAYVEPTITHQEDSLEYTFPRKLVRRFVAWALERGIDLENELDRAVLEAGRATDNRVARVTNITLRISQAEHQQIERSREEETQAMPAFHSDESEQKSTGKETQMADANDPESFLNQVKKDFENFVKPIIRHSDDKIVNQLISNHLKEKVSLINMIQGLRYKFQRKEANSFVNWAKQWGINLEGELARALQSRAAEATEISLRISHAQHKLFIYIRDNKLEALPALKEQNSYQKMTTYKAQGGLYNLDADIDSDKDNIDNLNNRVSAEMRRGETPLETVYCPAEKNVYLRFKTLADAVTSLDLFQKLILARAQSAYQSDIAADCDLTSTFSSQAYVIKMTHDEYQVVQKDGLLPTLQDEEEKVVDTRAKTLEEHLKVVSRCYPQIDFYKKNPYAFSYASARSEEKNQEVIEENRVQDTEMKNSLSS